MRRLRFVALFVLRGGRFLFLFFFIKNQYHIKSVTFGTNLDAGLNSKNYMEDLGEDGPKTYYDSEGNSFDKAYVAPKGKAYAVVLYTLRNVGTEPITYYGDSLKLIYADNNVYSDVAYSTQPMIYAITRDPINKIDLTPSGVYSELYTVFLVPKEVMTNTSESLHVCFIDQEWRIR